MFTGIVEEIGTVASVRHGSASAVLTLTGAKVLEDIHLGDSIAVDGVCLTVTAFTTSQFSVDVMHETLERSSLATIRPGQKVNLERAMAADGRFGGHMVLGHIDGCGVITGIRKDDNAIWYTVSAGDGILKYLVQKGSIAIDGISLTIAMLTEKDFAVSIIPHTASQTTLAQKKVGAKVNLETDIVGKYVEIFVGRNLGVQGTRRGSGESGAAVSGVAESGVADNVGRSGSVTLDLLARNGYL
jgi:riboflavin synthase